MGPVLAEDKNAEAVRDRPRGGRSETASFIIVHPGSKHMKGSEREAWRSQPTSNENRWMISDLQAFNGISLTAVRLPERGTRFSRW